MHVGRQLRGGVSQERTAALALLCPLNPNAFFDMSFRPSPLPTLLMRQASSSPRASAQATPAPCKASPHCPPKPCAVALRPRQAGRPPQQRPCLHRRCAANPPPGPLTRRPQALARMAPRDYDVCVLGAGMYGSRAAADLLRLAAEAGMPLRLALAGRSLERLEAARTHVLQLVALDGNGQPGMALLPGADASDAGAMAELAASTRVLVNGMPMIE